MEVTVWLSKTLALSWLFPLRTLATQNLLETHIPTSHSQKNLVTCHFESVSGALPKKKDERAVLKEQERVYAPDGETVPVYIRAPKLSYKSYLVSARSTPGLLLLQCWQTPIPAPLTSLILILFLPCTSGFYHTRHLTSPWKEASQDASQKLPQNSRLLCSTKMS